MLKKNASLELGADLKQLRLEVDSRIPDILRVRITDPHEKRWEVPRELLAKTPEEVAGSGPPPAFVSPVLCCPCLYQASY